MSNTTIRDLMHILERRQLFSGDLAASAIDTSFASSAPQPALIISLNHVKLPRSSDAGGKASAWIRLTNSGDASIPGDGNATAEIFFRDSGGQLTPLQQARELLGRLKPGHSARFKLRFALSAEELHAGGSLLARLISSSGMIEASHDIPVATSSTAAKQLTMLSSAPPAIRVTKVPRYGDTTGILKGKVSVSNPGRYRVFTVIQVDGRFWEKPTFAAPLTKIQPDKTFTCRTVSGGSDYNATAFYCFLVPAGFVPNPAVGGQTEIPAQVIQAAVASTHVERPAPQPTPPPLSSDLIDGPGTPSLTYTSTPAFGSNDDLKLHVSHVRAADVKTVTFLYVNGQFWIKPYLNQESVPVDAQGNAVVDVTTGGVDTEAVEFDSLLLPVGQPVNVSGPLTQLPADLVNASIATAVVHRA